MNDAQSTIVGLKFQDCPGGGWNGMPPEVERATVADCLAHGVCGCIYGDAVQHIERLRAALKDAREFVAGMNKPAASGVFQISSYHPCQALIDKIDVALAGEQSKEPKP